MSNLLKVEAFKSAHPTVWAWMENNAPTFEFAASLRQSVLKYGSLTAKQRLAAEKFAMKSAVKKAEAAPMVNGDLAHLFDCEMVESAPVSVKPQAREMDASKLADALRAAKKTGIQYPKMRFSGFVASLAGDASKNPGAIYLKNGEIYLGKISADNQFYKSRECTAQDVAAIETAMVDPLNEAVAYGRRTGTCSCCGRELTNKISIDLGIGPICREKFGL